MDKTQFKIFCDKYFRIIGFEKYKNLYYLNGDAHILCALKLQKSNYSNTYYVNYYYFLGDFNDSTKFPTIYDSDIDGRISVMSKNMLHKGEHFMTAQIEYEEYSEEELEQYFDIAFNDVILPPISQGKKYILNHLKEKYFLTLNQEEVLKKLRSK